MSKTPTTLLFILDGNLRESGILSKIMHVSAAKIIKLSKIETSSTTVNYSWEQHMFKVTQNSAKRAKLLEKTKSSSFHSVWEPRRIMLCQQYQAFFYSKIIKPRKFATSFTTEHCSWKQHIFKVT